jgi:hypothetical protein
MCRPPGKWVATDTGRDLHVTPIRDMKRHRYSRRCWCAPKLEAVEGGVLVLHQAMDGRELVEEHGLQ